MIQHLICLLCCGIFGISLMALPWKECSILLPAQPTAIEEHAARLLADELQATLHTAIPIRKETETAAKGIHIGATAKSLALLPAAELAALPLDSVVLQSTPEGELLLRGSNDRGQLYSVFVLMEKAFGVRYLAIDCTVRPSPPPPEIPILQYRYSPPIASRDCYVFDALNHEMSLRLRQNGGDRQLSAEDGGKYGISECHTMFTYCPVKEFSPTHPEYYSLLDGKRCFDWWKGAQLCFTNPEVLQIVTERVLKRLDEHPEIAILDLSQMDCGVNPRGCECPACQKVLAEEGAESGPMLRFVNAVARKVAQTHPKTMISTFAYQHTTKPPKLTRPEPNVIIRFCISGCYNHGLQCPGTQNDPLAMLAGWQRLTHNIFLWGYSANYPHFLAPNCYLLPMAQDLKMLISRGASGILELGDWQSPGGELETLRAYLISQLLWNPAQDPQTLITEFCRGFYQKAADAVLEYLQLLETTGRQSASHPDASWDPAHEITPAFVQQAMQILDRAAAQADSPAVLARVDLLRLSFWYMGATWPDRYPMTVPFDRILALSKQFHITKYGEGGPDRDFMLWYNRVSNTPAAP